jgi:hypothetical protein
LFSNDIDQQIDVAAPGPLSPGDGTEDEYVPCSMLGGNAEHLVAFPTQLVGDPHFTLL